MAHNEKINYNLESIYSRRSQATEAYRDRFWTLITQSYLSQWIKPSDTVLDLGSGHGEFIRAVSCAKKYAMDLNPLSRDYVTDDTEFVEQDCSQPWPLPDGSLDVVFTSNFFEHLTSRQQLIQTLKEARRCLKPDGYIICIGPNIRYATAEYWDRFDHYIALSHLSLAEAIEISGYKVSKCVGQFLPYSMIGFNPPLVFLKLYLSMPWAWKFIAKQFLVVARNLP